MLLPPHSPALPRQGAEENTFPGRGQGRRCCRLPATAAGARRSRYFPSRLPSAAAPVPLPPLPPRGSASLQPHGKHTQSPAPAPATRPIQINKQKPTPSQSQPDGKLSNDFFFQVLKRQGAPGEGKKGASISRPGREGGQSCRGPGSVRPSVLPDDGTGTRAGVRWVCLQEPGGREGGDGGS